MTFPVEQTTATTTQTSNSTSWGAQNMPSGIVAGDTLLALVACDGPDRTITFTGGWTKLLDGATGSDGTVTLGIAYKKAIGSDTLSLSISSTEQGSCRVIRIDTADDPDIQAPEIGAVTTGASATPNVGLITPIGGAKDYKFYSVCAHDRNRTFTSGPTNYQANDRTLSSGGANGAQLSDGDRDLNASSDDPDNFTYSQSDGFATVVVAIHPVPPPGPISAALPISFAVVADLKAQGKLDAALATVYNVTADLKAIGKLDAALPISFAVAPNLTARGKLDAVLPMTFNIAADLKALGKLDGALATIFAVTADLKANGKLDATLSIIFNVVADLTEVSGAAPISAILPFSFGVTADLKAQGKLDAALAMVFLIAADLKARGQLISTCAWTVGVTADLRGTGQLVASPAIAFNVAANLVDSTPALITGGIELIGRTIELDLTGRVP